MLVDLPFDISLKIFGECDVGDVLNLSREYTFPINRFSLSTAPQTCKRLNQVSGEHQTWLNHVTRFQISRVPTGDAPSTAALKNRAVSWVKSEELWIKPRDDDYDRFLDLHKFNTRQEEFMPFVMASLIPGGDFVVILYSDGQIDLQEIKIGSNGKWNLQAFSSAALLASLS